MALRGRAVVALVERRGGYYTDVVCDARTIMRALQRTSVQTVSPACHSVTGWNPLTPKLSGSENDILVLHPGVSETCEIHYVTDADTRSFSDDCDLGVHTSRYAHPSPILGWKPIPVCARPIGPALSTPVAVTRGEGVGGERAAILASDTHSTSEYGLCMHAGRFSSVHRV